MQKINIFSLIVMLLITSSLKTMETISKKLAGPQKEFRKELIKIKEKLPQEMQQKVSDVAKRLRELSTLNDVDKESELEALRDKIGKIRLQMTNTVRVKGRENINFSEEELHSVRKLLKQLE